MKKLVLVLFSILFIGGVVACSSNDDNEASKDDTEVVDDNEVTENGDATDKEVDEEEAQEQEDTDTEDEEEDAAKEDKEENNGDKIPDKMADFEETEIVAEHVDLNDVNIEIETDNQNKRVILYKAENNDGEKYKSIYIKEKNRLKLINLKEDDGLIYNDTI